MKYFKLKNPVIKRILIFLIIIFLSLSSVTFQAKKSSCCEVEELGLDSPNIQANPIYKNEKPTCTLDIPEGFPDCNYKPEPWTEGVVYFEFASNVSSGNQLKTLIAMQEWMDTGANIAFVPRNNEPAYILIADWTANKATVGMRSYGPQNFHIKNWDNKFIICHELGHTLGFWHEHQRWDWDDHVWFVLDNVKEGKEHNFDEHLEDEWITTVTEYDFDSIMHYSQCSFSKCDDCPDDGSCEEGGRTIIVHDPWNEMWQDEIGHLDHLSTLDIVDMKLVYGTGHVTYVDHKADENKAEGTLPYPYVKFKDGYNNNPEGGTLWTRSGNYKETGTFSKSMTWRTYLGTVTIGEKEKSVSKERNNNRMNTNPLFKQYFEKFLTLLTMVRLLLQRFGLQ